MNKRTLKVRQKLLGFIFMERSFKELCVHKLIRKNECIGLYMWKRWNGEMKEEDAD